MTNNKEQLREEKTSQIGGSGYGDSHFWIRGSTNQGGFGQDLSSFDKATHYNCETCGAGFTHRYDVVPDIFTAIENSGVPSECEIK